MNEDELREKIYELLGLEIGSLSSESGNDWERSKKEVLDDYRREQLKNTSHNNEINYTTINKLSKEFQFVLNSYEATLESKREDISKRTDLDENELSTLIQNSSKEILINVVRNYKLSETLIDKIIDKSVYLVVKYIIEFQSLSSSNIEKIKAIMNRNQSIYSDLLTVLEIKLTDFRGES